MPETWSEIGKNTRERGDDMKRIRKYRWYHPAYYAKLERWLSEMSEQGLRLCRYGYLWYEFEPETPKQCHYFAYCGRLGYRRGNGKYDFLMLYPFVAANIGRSKGSSKLNRFSQKALVDKKIIEIDEKKSEQCYKDMIADRNSMYRHYLMKQLGVLAGFLVALTILFVLS